MITLYSQECRINTSSSGFTNGSRLYHVIDSNENLGTTRTINACPRNDSALCSETAVVVTAYIKARPPYTHRCLFLASYSFQCVILLSCWAQNVEHVYTFQFHCDWVLVLLFNYFILSFKGLSLENIRQGDSNGLAVDGVLYKESSAHSMRFIQSSVYRGSACLTGLVQHGTKQKPSCSGVMFPIS